MTRFITTMLTLALITGLSYDNASAQQGNATPNLALSMISTGESGMGSDDHPNLHHTFVDYIWAIWQDCNDYDGVKDAFRPYIEGTPHALPHLSYPNLTGPIGGTLDRTPAVIDSDCRNVVDLWIELVDAGYTQDEAFDLVEMVMGSSFSVRLPH